VPIPTTAAHGGLSANVRSRNDGEVHRCSISHSVVRVGDLLGREKMFCCINGGETDVGARRCWWSIAGCKSIAESKH
jgi:hypothetical protein